MRQTRCPICGRERDESLVDSVDVGGHWFCSPSHLLEYEGRDSRRGFHTPLRTRLAIAAAGAAGAAALIAYAFFGPAFHGPSRLSRQQLFQMAAEVLEAQSGKPNVPPLHLTDRLTPAAIGVGDAYVRDAFVTHSCAALLLIVTPGSSTPSWCKTELIGNRQLGNYLISRPPAVEHNCAYPVIGGGTLTAVECLSYTVMSRSAEIGKPLTPACSILPALLWLRFSGGRWTVLNEETHAISLRICTKGDLALWKRRVPYQDR